MGVEASLRTLRAAADLARRPPPSVAEADPMVTAPRPLPQRAAGAALQPLVDRIRSVFPESTWPMLGAGLARVVEFQDVAYGAEYLNRMTRVLEWERRAGHGSHALTTEAARQVAVAMAYDDIIRVADLKTRGDRLERVRGELGATAHDVVSTEEYFHPRLEEFCAALPNRIGAWVESSPRLRAWLAPRLDRGRRAQSATLIGYLQLRTVASLRRWRRATLRHAHERAHLDAWLALAEAASAHDGALALELIRCRQLVKGYSDTHARGSSRFDRVMAAANSLAGQPHAARAIADLREAARRDASGDAFEACWRGFGLPAPASAR